VIYRKIDCIEANKYKEIVFRRTLKFRRFSISFYDEHELPEEAYLRAVLSKPVNSALFFATLRTSCFVLRFTL